MIDGLGQTLEPGQKVVWSPASTYAGFLFGVVHHLSAKMVSIHNHSSNWEPSFNSLKVKDPASRYGYRFEHGKGSPNLSNVRPQNLIVVDRILDHGIV